MRTIMILLYCFVAGMAAASIYGVVHHISDSHQRAVARALA